VEDGEITPVHTPRPEFRVWVVAQNLEKDFARGCLKVKSSSPKILHAGKMKGGSGRSVGGSVGGGWEVKSNVKSKTI
jgi:hypothetical protein